MVAQSPRQPQRPELRCPAAPMKPKLRPRPERDNNSDKVLQYARDALEPLSGGERSSALEHLPRHTLEGVFLAFCHWQADSTSPSGKAFCGLLQQAPNLDSQIVDAALAAFPDVSWDEWCKNVLAASKDPQQGKELAQAFMQSMAGSTRRTLGFD